LDPSPNDNPMLPQQTYIVAATPRTGSNLLCEGLERSGIAGRPAETFAPHLRDVWAQYFALRPGAMFAEYFDAAIRYGTTMNGVHGLKIHWMHVAPLADEVMCMDDVLQHLFPAAVFINIVRHDKRAQAMSWYRAEMTNEWLRYADDASEPAPCVFDPAAIGVLERNISCQQLAWEEYFSKRVVDVLTVDYEALASDYHRQVGLVLAFLGLDASVAQSIPSPRLVRQADGLSAHWRALMMTHPDEIDL
jgi:trehalose 2-sulfotransferase